MKKFTRLFTLGVCSFIVLFACALAFAQVPEVPPADPLSAALSLIMGWKQMSALAIGVAAVLLLANAVKQFMPVDVDGKPKYKRLVTLLLACAYGVLISLVSGVGLVPSLVLILVTKGGASELYEALKGVGWLKS